MTLIPEKVPAAKCFERVTYLEVIQKGLAVMEFHCDSLCMDNRHAEHQLHRNGAGEYRPGGDG